MCIRDSVAQSTFQFKCFHCLVCVTNFEQSWFRGDAALLTITLALSLVGCPAFLRQECLLLFSELSFPEWGVGPFRDAELF